MAGKLWADSDGWPGAGGARRIVRPTGWVAGGIVGRLACMTDGRGVFRCGPDVGASNIFLAFLGFGVGLVPLFLRFLGFLGAAVVRGRGGREGVVGGGGGT